MKEFETIVGVTKSVLKQLLGSDIELKTQRIDEGGIDGDLCAIVTAGNKQAVAVVWPTAEKLKQIKQLAEVSSGGLSAGLCSAAAPMVCKLPEAASSLAMLQQLLQQLLLLTGPDNVYSAAATLPAMFAQDKAIQLLLVVNPLWKVSAVADIWH